MVTELLGVVANKEAYTVFPGKIISHRKYFVVPVAAMSLVCAVYAFSFIQLATTQ